MKAYLFHTLTAACALSMAGSNICFVGKAGDPGAAGGGAKPAGAQTDAGPATEAAAAAAPAIEGAEPADIVEAPSLAEPASLGFANIKHPQGASSVSHGGQTYEADKKGVIQVPLAAVEDLTSHGFTLV